MVETNFAAFSWFVFFRIWRRWNWGKEMTSIQSSNFHGVCRSLSAVSDLYVRRNGKCFHECQTKLAVDHRLFVLLLENQISLNLARVLQMKVYLVRFQCFTHKSEALP